MRLDILNIHQYLKTVNTKVAFLRLFLLQICNIIYIIVIGGDGMTVGEKMKFRRKELKISADEIAKALGVSRSTIFRYEKGEIEKLPTENLRKIAEVLKTTPEELMGWTETENNFSIVSIYNQLVSPRQQKVYDFAKHELEEQQESERKNKIQSLQKYREMKEQKEEFADIEWYGCASAGTGEFMFDNKEVISLPKKQIPLEADFCLTVNGDSMEPLIHHHDYIFVSKQDTLFNGNIGVVIVDGEAFIKKVFFENDKARLQSFNKKYKDIIVDDSNDFRIIGKVVL